MPGIAKLLMDSPYAQGYVFSAEEIYRVARGLAVSTPPAGCLSLSASSVNQALWWQQQHPSLLSCLFSVPGAMSPLFLVFWDGWALSIFHLLLKGPLFCVSQNGEGGVVELTFTSLWLTRAHSALASSGFIDRCFLAETGPAP